jgi:DNA-binding transcriptional ArsR family regulator
MMTGRNKRQKNEARPILSVDKCAERLKAVADPDRLRIVECLRMGELTVSDISEILPMEIARLSHHRAL